MFTETTISLPGRNDAPANDAISPAGAGIGHVVPDASPKGYWDARAHQFARQGAGLAAVCSYGMPSFYNSYIDLLQRRALDRWLIPTRQGTVLEIGCGVGRWTRRLARTGTDVVGLDLSETMIAEARRRARRDGVHERCRFLVADSAEFALRARFDRIVGITVLQHVLDPARFRATIERLAAHLARGGLIILLEAAPCRLDERCNSDVFVAREESTYLETFASAGLRCVAVQGVDTAPFKTWLLPWYRHLPRPLAVAGLFVATAAAFPIDILAARWGRAIAWHKVFVLAHAADDEGLGA